ncbi:MAG TPA: hypothetical protein VGS09_02705 [Actinomycetota bacterium]|nr:hypothetical protein [Actinomycetota bacterium]
MLGRSYPPVNVRSAAWYLAGVALLAVPVFLLLSSGVSGTPRGALEAAPEVGSLIAQAAGLMVVSALLYMGFRFMYPIALLLLLVFAGRALLVSRQELLEILVPLPALLLLATPSAVRWFLGEKTIHTGVAEREFHLPHR